MHTLIENFFSNPECNSAINEVTENKELWYQCDETDMYILGNSFLRKRFSNYLTNNIYHFNTVSLFREKLLTLFSKVEFANNLGKPGFQIIKKNESKRPTVWHYDNIISCFPYYVAFPDYNNKFNDYFEKYYIFTLILSESSSSFDYYPETKSRFSDNPDQLPSMPICKNHANMVGNECINPKCKLTEFQTVSFSQGSLFIQEERTLHRLGSKDIDGTNDSRIALQGYGLVKNGTMYLCW